VRTASHLAHEPLLLHLATELPKRLLELFGILDDYAHNPERIPVARQSRSVKRVAGPRPLLLQDVGADGSADCDHREREREGADHHQGVSRIDRSQRRGESRACMVAGLD